LEAWVWKWKTEAAVRLTNATEGDKRLAGGRWQPVVKINERQLGLETKKWMIRFFFFCFLKMSRQRATNWKGIDYGSLTNKTKMMSPLGRLSFGVVGQEGGKNKRWTQLGGYWVGAPISTWHVAHMKCFFFFYYYYFSLGPIGWVQI